MPRIGDFPFDPETYLDDITADIPRYHELQEELAEATRGLAVERALELGTGTGETARRVLALHPEALLTGIDENAVMLDRARAALPLEQVAELRVARLQDPLPAGPFDLVFSALAVHHLDRHEKAELYARVAAALRRGGRFVLGDVVVPERADDALTPLTEGFDRPDPISDQLAWLEDAGFEARVAWAWKDVAVLVADRPR